MSVGLADILKELALKPGECRCVNIADYQVEIRRAEFGAAAQAPMLDLWLDIPFSDKAASLVVSRGEPQLPAPIEINDSDLAPE